MPSRRNPPCTSAVRLLSTAFVVPRQGSVPLDTNPTILQSAGGAPGARTTLTAETSEGTVDLLVPVVDGTLDPYRPYLPS
ncbi:hypothetical protein I6N91_06060 [Arthrobacter sp. MSA 4-2]|uniref:hypothetical protein n=1 Tax=Arthrobacter sp. MSA 4-2 TaxID=2794349 RepID=UPI0018E75A0B|nr:hypothetical protein [Arthrobacter sp. MSA 4-2]MBJ2120541.1 hypothetical protein [Arthrobacter sp. MSA 4-2]